MVNSFKEISEKRIMSYDIFELEKLLETVIGNIFRVQCIWSNIIKYIEKLLKLEHIRYKKMGIRVISYLIVKIFCYWKIQGNITGWPVDKWQVIILTPLMDAECINEKIANLSYIIENCHLYISKEGWEIVLKIINQGISFVPGNLPPPVINERVERAFKCIEIIVFYIDQLFIPNIETLLNLTLSFITLKSNSTISLSAVEFIQNVSDYLVRQQRKGLVESILNIWLLLFDTLKQVGISTYGDLRDAAYNIMEQIINSHLKDLPTKALSYATIDVAEELFKFLEKNYSNDKEDKAWERSIKILNKSFVNIIYKMHQVDKSDNKAWLMLLKCWDKFLVVQSYEILLTIYKLIKKLQQEAKDCIYGSFEKFWKIFCNSIIKLAANDQRLVSELSIIIMDIIKESFNRTIVDSYHIVSENVLSELFKVLKTILWSTSAYEGITENVTLENSIQADDIFGFIELLPTLFNDNKAYNEYLNFLMDFLDFQPNDPHSEDIIRRVLIIIKHLTVTLKNIIKPNIPTLYSKLASLISLRFKSNTTQTLWYDVGKFFINLSTYIINPDLYKAIGSGIAEKLLSNTTIPTIISPSKVSINKEMQDLVWTNVIKVIKSTLKPESVPSYGERFIGEEIVRKNQELDMMIINFILKALLPSSCDRPYEVQLVLIKFIDDGCIAFDNKFSNASAHAKASDTLSKYCISELIGLCNWNECKTDIDPIRQKIATIATPVLLNRCKNTFTNYILDEKRSGKVPLPR